MKDKKGLLIVFLLTFSVVGAVVFEVDFSGLWKKITSDNSFFQEFKGVQKNESFFLNVSGEKKESLEEASWLKISDENVVRVIVSSLDENGGNCDFSVVLGIRERDINSVQNITFDLFSIGHDFAVKVVRKSNEYAKCRLEADLNVA